MELVADNGCIVSIPRGCKKELGRGSELAIQDKTVSRHQILLELHGQSKEYSSGDSDTPFQLSIKVLGANPVCIVHVGRSTGRRSRVQEMILLRKGETDILFSGDRISLSLSLPMFLTVREGEGSKKIDSCKTRERVGSSAVVPMEKKMPAANAECSKLLTEDDLLGKWKNRKKEQKSGLCITQDREQAETSGNRQILASEDDATNEEEAGIAQAVARRQKKALERRLQREQNLRDKGTGVMKELEAEPDVEGETSKVEDITVNTQNIDPVKEFGFLVEGSEFEQYKKRHQPGGGRWIWPPAAKSPAESGSDEDDEDLQQKHARSKKGKKRTDEKDEEWRGDDQEENVAIASAKKVKAGPKVKLRSHKPSSSKKRDTAMRKAASSRREEIEDEDEDEDEADETLGGFIVDDNEEDDPLDDNTEDEEDEASDDEEMDEAEEEDEEDAQHNKSKKKKPLCKYGKKCYRKNPDHLRQYRH